MSKNSSRSSADLAADEVGGLLGSHSIVRIWNAGDDWEENLARLTASFADRLVSSGGRPTDPEWTMSRRVPLAPDTWASLQALADQLGSPGHAVAPAQVAAALLEEGVAELDKIIKNRQQQSD